MAEGRSKKKNLFEREATILKGAKVKLAKEDLTLEEAKVQLEEMANYYEELLDQSKLITKVSDRLQKKINKANEALEQKNGELQATLDALTQAKLSRRATTITMVLFVVLFLLSEGLVEPPIEEYAHTLFPDNNAADLAFSLGIKVLLALLLRPIEKIVERILVKRAQTEKEKEIAEQLANSGKMAPQSN